MLTRRKLLTGAASIAAFSAFATTPAIAGANVIFGAIRWDAWYDGTGSALSSQNALGPKVWHNRSPWFSKILNDYQISAIGTQANMDTEIACAKNAGIKYWAYTKYDPSSSLAKGWNLHQTSATKNDVNWCWIVQNQSDFGSTGNFSSQVAQFVSWFQQPNHQKVMSNRPLVYLLFNTPGAAFGDNNSNFAAMITALRTATVLAGLGTPYIVVMSEAGAAKSFVDAVGLDAISIYIPPVPQVGQPVPYSMLASAAAAYWVTQAATGAKIVPCVGFGGDTRPRKQNPVPSVLSSYIPAYSGMLNYVVPGTASECANHLSAAIAYVGANSSTCETTAIIAYAWDECDEGGGALIPTIGDPPQPGNTTNLLTAIGAVLN